MPGLSRYPILRIGLISLALASGCGGTEDRSLDLSFQTGIQVSHLTGAVTTFPPLSPRSLAVDGEHIMVVWADSGDDQVYLALSLDDGLSFGDRLQVSRDQAIRGTAPQIAVGPDGTIFVVWEGKSMSGETDFDVDITFSHGRLKNDILEFSDPVVVNDDADEAMGRDHFSPAVAADGAGNVYLAWEDPRDRYPANDIYLVKGVPNMEGEIVFGENLRVTPDASDLDDHAYPSIGVDEDLVVSLAWVGFQTDSDNPMQAIYLSRGQEVFEEPVRIGGEEGDTPLFPSLVVGPGGGVSVAWQTIGQATQNSDIFVAGSPEGGGSFGPPLQVTDAAFDQVYPSLSLHADGDLILAWQDEVGEGMFSEVAAARIAPGPQGVLRAGSEFRIGEDPVTASRHSPSVQWNAQGHAFVVWIDERELCPPGSSACLFLARSQ